MKKGILIYDSSTNRFDVLYEEGNSYGGLHCGTAMEVLINDEWIPTRIEYGNDWYLVGVQKESLPGLQVRTERLSQKAPELIARRLYTLSRE